MKKIAIFLAFIVSAVSIIFAGCGSNNVIRLNEVTHSIFYAPFYAAINLGYFEEEGIQLEVTNGGGSDASMNALLSKTADLALLGPETAVYVVAEGARNAPVIFGQLTKRDGSFLVGRTNETNFSWTNLANKEIIGGRRGGSPAMSLQYGIEQAGLTIGTGTGEANINLDVAFNLVVSAFESGQGDYCTMFEPVASEYVAAGKGYIVASVGEQSGEIPFTCFMALQSYIDKNEAKIEGFLRAVSRAYNYLVQANDEQIIAALKPSFSTTADSLIISSVRNYIRIDAWKSTPVMSSADYQRLLTIMINAGELEEDKAPLFADVVNNSYAENVMRSMS
jgi:NitT/TauT family transport system substrate-binding protein